MGKKRKRKLKESALQREATVQQFAEAIATDILTMRRGASSELDGEGNLECHRVQLMFRKAFGDEVNMGGRNKESLIHTITPYLREMLESRDEELERYRKLVSNIRVGF